MHLFQYESRQLVMSWVVVSLCMALLAAGGCNQKGNTGPKAPGPDVGSEVDVSVADGAPADAQPVPVDNVAGSYPYTMVVDGMEREFVVYVPESAAGETAAPLVVMIHGTAQSGQEFYDKKPGWRDQADLVGAIVVFPTSLTYCYFQDMNGDGEFSNPGERRVKTKWTNKKVGVAATPFGYPLCDADDIASLRAGNAQDKADADLVDHPVVDDVNFVDEMLAFIGQKHRIDASRIYATGFSNGSAFTLRLLVERSDVFAAFGANAAGIGLAIAHRIVTEHRGSIGVENNDTKHCRKLYRKSRAS